MASEVFDIKSLSLEDTYINRLKDYLRLMLEENQRVNLTSIKNFEEGWLLHVEDSLLGILAPIKPNSTIADIGSGNGFPGVALSIATGNHVDLIESLSRKAMALEKLISECSLEDQVTVINKRVEEITSKGKYDYVVARAVTTLPSLLELASPILKIGGTLICYKGEPDVEEIEGANKICDKIGYLIPIKKEFLLSDRKTTRTLLLYQKAREADVKLPRRPGMAQKRPYK